MVASLDFEKIRSALSSFEETEKAIITAGSDEHLDLILDYQNSLVQSTEKVKLLVEAIENTFNLFNAENVEEFVLMIFPMFEAAKKISQLVEEHAFYNEVKGHLTEFNDEVNELFEIVNDLVRYKGKDAIDHNSLFND